MIQVKRSPTADTRTCDPSAVTKEDLIQASKEHILDVQRGVVFFQNMLYEASLRHDDTKITDIDRFHKDFIASFKTTTWWDNHRKVERHHLSHEDGVRDDVTLIDVLEYVTDCVMAGKARAGVVTPLKISDEVLRKAFENTWRLLERNVEVAP